MPSARSWRAYPQTYRLEAGRCDGCGKTFYPQRQVCDACGGRAFTVFRLGFTGKVVSHTLIRTPGDAYSGEAPFAVAIVAMDDGPRLTAQLVDVAPEEIAVGMPVRLQFRRLYAEGHDGVLEYGHKAVPVRD